MRPCHTSHQRIHAAQQDTATRSCFRPQRFSISTGTGLDGFYSRERTEQVRAMGIASPS